MNVLGYTNWTEAEVAVLDRIVSTGADLRKRDLLLFPGRTEKSIVRKASLRRKALGFARAGKGDHRRVTFTKVDIDMAVNARQGSEALHRATVRMCIRNGVTLPGLSPAHTIAMAKNMGIVA